LVLYLPSGCARVSISHGCPRALASRASLPLVRHTADNLPAAGLWRPQWEPTEGYTVPGPCWFVTVGSCSTPGLRRAESAVSQCSGPETSPLLGQPSSCGSRIGARVDWFVITPPPHTFAYAIPSHPVRGSPDLASVSAPLSPCLPRIEGQSHPGGLYCHPSAAGVGLVAKLLLQPVTHLRRYQVGKEPRRLFAARPPIRRWFRANGSHCKNLR
jgi:hypothetical protein